MDNISLKYEPSNKLLWCVKRGVYDPVGHPAKESKNTQFRKEKLRLRHSIQAKT
jgi:hypothetical protein